MLDNETIGLDSVILCEDCRSLMRLQVCRSNVGYYLGYFCNTCGPYSRESVYFASEEEAEEALKNPLQHKRT